MPAPATVDELLEIVVKSGVTDEARLKAYSQRLADRGERPADPNKMAGQLVRDGLLTYFQAEQLLQGKWKRFTIGKYKVLERIGAGGMGQVFLCEHKYMRRRVAVKVLPTAKADEPASLERFYREARAVAAVDHPNIVRAYDIDQDDNLHFLVMEYVDGTNLQDLIKKTGPLELLRACHYIYGSAVGLQHAHEMGLVHRDIKPGNILVDRSGVVKILDLGLARFFHDEDDNLTKKYDENVLGTADYLAPEQALESHTVDIRADIYSLGATFYFLLTASAPFPEGSVAQKLIWHQTRQPKPVKAFRPEVPDDLLAIVERMMAKDLANRYQTPGEVIAALAPWVTSPIAPPDVRELPDLSPAAMGTAGQTTRSQAAVSATLASSKAFGLQISAPSTHPGLSPTVAAGSWPGTSAAGAASPGAGLSSGTAPAPVGPPAVAAAAVWEGLESETKNDDPSDTDRPALAVGRRAADRAKPPSGTKLPSNRKGLRIWASIAGVVLLASLLVGMVYWFVLRDPAVKPTPKPSDSPVGPTPATGRAARTLTVSSKGGEGVFPTLRRAIEHVRPGDTILIAEERIAESPLKLSGPNFKDVTLASGLPGRKVAVLQFAPDASGSGTMFELSQIEGMKLQNLAIECKDRPAEIGIAISGHCPGLVLDGLSFDGMKGCAVQLQDVTGTPQSPVVLENLSIRIEHKSQAGISFEASPQQRNHHVVVRNSRFEGLSPANWKPPANLKPGDPKPFPPTSDASAIRFDGPADDIEISFDRFFNVNRGVAFAKLTDGVDQVSLVNDTFHTVRIGVYFDFSPLDTRGKYPVSVVRNYFAKTDNIVKHNGAQGSIKDLKYEDNVRESNSREGNVTIYALQPEAHQMQRPNSNSPDADFLRNQPFTSLGKGAGPNKVRVGFYAD